MKPANSTGAEQNESPRDEGAESYTEAQVGIIRGRIGRTDEEISNLSEEGAGEDEAETWKNAMFRKKKPRFGFTTEGLKDARARYRKQGAEEEVKLRQKNAESSARERKGQKRWKLPPRTQGNLYVPPTKGTVTNGVLFAD